MIMEAYKILKYFKDEMRQAKLHEAQLVKVKRPIYPSINIVLYGMYKLKKEPHNKSFVAIFLPGFF